MFDVSVFSGELWFRSAAGVDLGVGPGGSGVAVVLGLLRLDQNVRRRRICLFVISVGHGRRR